MTGFSQTPFAQRYHDEKRSEQALMRSHISKANAEDDSDGDDVPALLRMHVPDHLPGSPLCPIEPTNYQSSGRRICLLHGSRKSMLASAQKRKSKVGGGQRGSLTGTVKREPEIVFNSGDGGGRL